MSSWDEGAPATEWAEVDHRDWLYMAVGWELMDLRQDIDFHQQLMAEPYPAKEVIDRLLNLQREVGRYADQHFPIPTFRTVHV